MTHTVDTGKPANYPRVLGLTTEPDAHCPALTLTQVDGVTVKFEPLQTEMFEVHTVAVGVMTDSLGSFDVRSDREWFWDGLGPSQLQGAPFRPPAGAPSGTYQVSLEFDADTVERVLALEREHYADFAYSYDKTIGHLARCVQDLAGQEYTGSDKAEASKSALEALAAAVGPAFVPAYPMVLSSWSTLACQHFRALADQSDKRDKKPTANHLGSWAGRLVTAPGSPDEPGDLRVMSVVPDPGKSPAELIDLSVLKRLGEPDWSSTELPNCPFVKGQYVEVTADLHLANGTTIPTGWIGRFSGPNAAMTKFEFGLRKPSEHETAERDYLVPPAQFSRLRAVAGPAKWSDAVTREPPFPVGHWIRTTQGLTTLRGVEVPVNSRGQVGGVDDNGDGTFCLSVDFFEVRSLEGRPLLNAALRWADLGHLEACAEPSSDELAAQAVGPGQNADTGSAINVEDIDSLIGDIPAFSASGDDVAATNVEDIDSLIGDIPAFSASGDDTAGTNFDGWPDFTASQQSLDAFAQESQTGPSSVGDSAAAVDAGAATDDEMGCFTPLLSAVDAFFTQVGETVDELASYIAAGLRAARDNASSAQYEEVSDPENQ